MQNSPPSAMARTRPAVVSLVATRVTCCRVSRAVTVSHVPRAKTAGGHASRRRDGRCQPSHAVCQPSVPARTLRPRHAVRSRRVGAAQSTAWACTRRVSSSIPALAQ